MSTVRDSFIDLEKHRQRLEDNVVQLQNSLQHWQTWDAEYEALKEEIEAISSADAAKEFRRIRNDFEGDLLKGKEIDEIFGQPGSKSKDQVINVLERRIDYVTKNIENLQKQVETTENKLAAATVISQPDATDEDGQPITDIIEQLDDDDNVISYRLNKAGDSFPQVEQVLKKAGVTDIEDGTPDSEEQPRLSPTTETKVPLSKGKLPNSAPSEKKIVSSAVVENDVPVKKSVSFDDKTTSNEEPEPEMSWRARRVDHIMKTAKQDESLSKEEPTLPEDEDPEDAELRQQMLKYGMSEIGAVVAELELEEINSDDSDFDEGFDENWDDEEEEEEDDEDEYGRTKSRVVTSSYRNRMLQLEKKLGIKSRFTEAEAKVPKADDTEDSDSGDEGIGRIVVKRETTAAPKTKQVNILKPQVAEGDKDSSSGKKGVRFAENLNIAAEKESPAPKETEKKDIIEPLSDIVERSTGSSKPSEPQPARKASRFKKTKDSTNPIPSMIKGPLDMPSQFMEQNRPKAPTGPDGTTIADKLVERESSSAAVPPDEFNDSIAYREVADEYQKVRRKFIQRDGGFLKENERAIEPVEDEEDQEPISRFKAARLSRQ